MKMNFVFLHCFW